MGLVGEWPGPRLRVAGSSLAESFPERLWPQSKSSRS